MLCCTSEAFFGQSRAGFNENIIAESACKLVDTELNLTGHVYE